MADHHHRSPLEPGSPADDGWIVGEAPVPVELPEALEDLVDIVLGIGTPGMAGDLGYLPGGQAAVDLLRLAAGLALEPLDLFADVEVGLVGDIAQLLDLRFQLGDRLLEVEKTVVHKRQSLLAGPASRSAGAPAWEIRMAWANV